MSVFEIRPASWCRHEYKNCPEGCPLDSAEGRLREAHRRWHDCLDSYQEPEDFRDSLNGCVQALRNVTFQLQSSKASVPGFDDWYAEEQEGLRTDPVMRWVVSARNRVVKAGDLSLHSRLTVRLVSGYHDEAEALRADQLQWSRLASLNTGVDVETMAAPSVHTTPAEVSSKLRRLNLPRRVRQDSTVLLERRWVVEDLPEVELLYVLAHAYGKLRSLLSRGHSLLGLQSARFPVWDEAGVVDRERVEWLAELPQEGRQPCMSSSQHRRTARYRLADGTEVREFGNFEVSEPPGLTEDSLVAAYGERRPYPEDLGDLQGRGQLERLVAWQGEMAAGILRSGQDHGWFTHYFRMGHRVDQRLHMSTDAQGKQAVAGEVARIALEVEADLVIVMSEIWLSPAVETVDGAYLPPGLHPDRLEAVAIYAAAKSGAEASRLVPFRVLEGEPPNRRVEIDEAVDGELSDLGLLQPTRRAWGIRPPRRSGASFFRPEG